MVNLQQESNSLKRLTFLRRADRQRMAIYKCDCGNELAAYITNVNSGKTLSCGCLRSELTQARSTTHGHAKRGQHSLEYETWTNMIARCTKSYRPDYHRYGGRGITVCDRWLDFDNFFADMGSRPDGKTIDRWPNTNGNYEPGNCRWATPIEQANNRRSNVLIEHLGRNQNIEAWSAELGIERNIIEDRIRRGATTPSVIFGPIKKARIIEFKGKSQTVSQWASEIGLSIACINKRLKNGLSIDQALRR